MGEPQEQNNQLISLENESIYYEGITAEELTETLKNSSQSQAIDIFFNNLRLHIIDPIHLLYDEPQFQQDIQDIKKDGEIKYLKNYKTAEEALTKLTDDEEQVLLLSHIYIKMKEKGYQRYHEKEQCLVR